MFTAQLRPPPPTHAGVPLNLELGLFNPMAVEDSWAIILFIVVTILLTPHGCPPEVPERSGDGLLLFPPPKYPES